jgi:hypothetical protein
MRADHRGSSKPSPTNVTQKRSRLGKCSPFVVVTGIASAAASETMSRTPVKVSTNGIAKVVMDSCA